MPNIVQIAGVAHPTASMRRRMGIVRALGGGPNAAAMIAGSEAVDALARLLTEAIETRQTKDGRIDMRDVAAHVLAEMQRNGK